MRQALKFTNRLMSTIINDIILLVSIARIAPFTHYGVKSEEKLTSISQHLKKKTIDFQRRTMDFSAFSQIVRFSSGFNIAF